MQASLLVKIFLILPLILLVDYLAMVILGCASCLFGLGDDYYCNTYCIIGKAILLISAIIFGIIIHPNIKHYFQKKKYGTTQEK